MKLPEIIDISNSYRCSKSVNEGFKPVLIMKKKVRAVSGWRLFVDKNG